MVLTIKLTKKVWEINLVSRRVWLGVAVWQTRLSGLRGWQLKVSRYNLRVVTPLLGCGIVVDIGANA